MKNRNIQRWMKVSTEEHTDPEAQAEIKAAEEAAALPAVDTNDEVDVAKPETVTLEPTPEAGTVEEVPKPDEQVEALPVATEVQVISAEEVAPVEPVVTEPVTAVVEDTPVGDVVVAVVPTPEGGATVEVTIETPAVETPVDPVEAAVYAADAAGTDTQVEQVQEQIEDVQEDIEQFTKISAAMEAYQRILQAGVDSGNGIQVDTAEAIRVGMESLDQYFVENSSIVSNEEFGETSSNLTATKVSLEGFKETFAQVVEAAQRALVKLFDMLYELWTAITGGAQRTLKRLEGIKDRIKGLSKDHVDHVVTVNGTARLTAGALFEGNNPSAVADIATVARYMYKDYPEQITGFAREANAIYTGLIPKPSDAPDAVMNKIATAMTAFLALPKSHLKAIPGNSPASTRELPSTLHGFDGVVRSKVLAGNFGLVQYISRTSVDRNDTTTPSAAVASIATIFNRIFNVQFLRLEGQPAAHPTEAFKLPAKRELQQVADELEGLLKMVVASDGNKQKYKAVKDSLSATVGKIMLQGKMVNPATGGTVPGLFNPMVMSLVNLSRLLTQPSGQFNGYVVSVCNAYVGLLNHNLEQFEAELRTKAA